MRGAREYAELFKAEQHGRLYLLPGSHARGRTFHIWVLPADRAVTNEDPWRVPGAVEVYGILGGQPGWTEYYGWLHRGKWEDDFAKIVATRKAVLQSRHEQEQIALEHRAQEERSRVAKLLADY